MQLDNIEIHKVTGQRDQEQYEKLDKDVEQKIKDYLSKPIHAKLSGGLVKQIDALVDDVEWSLNMKRGIVNLLQVAPANPEEETLVKQIEVTAALFNSIIRKIRLVYGLQRSLERFIVFFLLFLLRISWVQKP